MHSWRHPGSRGSRVVAALALLAAALTGCGGSDAKDAEDGSTPAVQPVTDSPSSLDSIESQRPRPGDCHAMTLREVTATSADDTSSDCLHGPTTITVAVGRLEVKGRAVAPDSPAAQDLMQRTCRPRAAAWLGTDARGLRLSRLTAVWFVPTPEQVEAGARWYRCDVVGFDRGDHLLPLPAPHRLERALGTDAGDRYALCGTTKPGDRRFQRVTCSMRHTWKAIATVDLAGGERYPGEKAVREGGDSACSDKVRAASGGTAMKYDYGWEWPTAQQWRAGQRYGFCWAPA